MRLEANIMSNSYYRESFECYEKIYTGDIEVIEKMLTPQNISRFERDIMAAAGARGDIDILQLVLLRCNPKVDDCVALSGAARSNIEAFRLLLPLSGPVLPTSIPIRQFACQNRLEMVQELMPYSDQKSIEQGFLAASQGNALSVAHYLSANVMISQKVQARALLNAMEYGHMQMMDVIFETIDMCLAKQEVELLEQECQVSYRKEPYGKAFDYFWSTYNAYIEKNEMEQYMPLGECASPKKKM